MTVIPEATADPGADAHDVRPEIVLISNDASETGAPRSLYTFAHWLAEHGKAKLRIVLAGGGPLEREFGELGPVYRTWRGDGSAVERVLRLSRVASWRMHRKAVLTALANARRRWNPSLIYANTITTGHEMEALRCGNTPVVTHVRELASLFPAIEQTCNLDATLRFSDRFIANSQATKDHLVRRYSVAPANVDVIHPFIDDTPEALHPPGTAGVRRDLGLDDSVKLVVGCGTLHSRKGTDLFVDVAATVRARRPRDDVHFVWIGGDTTELKRDDMARLLAERGLSTFVSFVGHRSDYRRFLADADLLLLTSREEPFGRVVLEAGLYAKPSICFADSGGAPEFVRDDAGRVVPRGDVAAMSTATIELLDSPQMRSSLGACARERVLRDHRVDTGAPRLWRILEHAMKARSEA
ncbi:MAG TPA: glycosyltransferase family 4 protein [Casimicrobiaceae bacterium]|nr:glycosyltransferase family 4 protein [Casimicrobiaceae bacterium]